jgi:MYXO-CTERM domain-containing protein
VTQPVSAGAHVLVAIARDAAGNTARSSAFSFTASDATTEPGPMTGEPPVPEVVNGSCGCVSADASLAIFGLVALLLRARRRTV